MQVEDSDGEKLDYFSDRMSVAHRRRKTIVPRNTSSYASRRRAKTQHTPSLRNRKHVIQDCLKRLTPAPLSDHGSSADSSRKRRIIAPIEELEFALARGITMLPFLRSSDRGRNAFKRRRSLSYNFRTLMPMEEFEHTLRAHNKRASSFSLSNGDCVDCGTTSSEPQTPSTSEKIESPSRVAIDRRSSSFGRLYCEHEHATPNWFNPSSTSSTVDAYREPPSRAGAHPPGGWTLPVPLGSGPWLGGGIGVLSCGVFRSMVVLAGAVSPPAVVSQQRIANHEHMLSFDFSTDISKLNGNPPHRYKCGLAPSTVNQAAFDESLRAIAEDGTDVGFYECSVNAGTNDKSVLVSARSEYCIEDTEYYTTLRSELDSQLNLLKEINEQTRKSKDQVTKRIIRTHRELDDLVVETEEWVGTESTKSTRRQSLSELGWYLANGAVLVVERIYAITSAETKFTVNTLDTDGVVCNLICEQLCERNVSYDNKTISELAMKQTIFSPTGNIITTHKYFSVHGQLLSLVQVGLPIVFKTVDLPPPVTKTQYLSTPNIMEDNFHWKDNYMLFSRFHERKEELKSQYHLYLYNHPEFVDIVKDFLLSILMEKPEDTLNFAADFFTTFSKRQLLPPRLKRT
ncbi:Ciliogenesis-associated TTC17-interacting protein [Taenia solium]|eukprot:TsM_000873200 transcript=TsM_000873200 gene=TsM_000873200